MDDVNNRPWIKRDMLTLYLPFHLLLSQAQWKEGVDLHQCSSSIHVSLFVGLDTIDSEGLKYRGFTIRLKT